MEGEEKMLGDNDTEEVINHIDVMFETTNN